MVNSNLCEYFDLVDVRELDEPIIVKTYGRADPFGSTEDIKWPFHDFAKYLKDEFKPCTLNWTYECGFEVELKGSDRNMVVNESLGTQEIYDDFFLCPWKDLFSRTMACFGLNNVAITIRSTMPPKSGLGGSGALTTGLCIAASRARNQIANEPMMPYGALVRVAHDIENIPGYISGIDGSITGFQDQLASLLHGVNFFDWLSIFSFDGRESILRRPELILAGAEEISKLNERTSLYYSGQSHDSNTVNIVQLESIVKGNKRILWFEEAARTREAKACFLNEDYPRLVELLNDSQDMRFEINGSVYANNFQHHVINIARKYNGAAKVAGAGNGGCVFTLAPDIETRERIDKEILNDIDKYYGCYKIDAGIKENPDYIWD